MKNGLSPCWYFVKEFQDGSIRALWPTANLVWLHPRIHSCKYLQVMKVQFVIFYQKIKERELSGWMGGRLWNFWVYSFPCTRVVCSKAAGPFWTFIQHALSVSGKCKVCFSAHSPKLAYCHVGSSSATKTWLRFEPSKSKKHGIFNPKSVQTPVLHLWFCDLKQITRPQFLYL